MIVNFEIRRKPKENDEKLLSRFVTKSKREGIVAELREKQRFVRPAEKLRQKRMKAQRRLKKEKRT